MIALAALLDCSLLRVGAASSITALDSFSKEDPVSSKPDAPRNLPKPNCAAPATPPSSDAKPVCRALYSSCAPTSSMTFCAMTSCSTAAVASSATVCFRAVLAPAANSSFCCISIASLAKARRPSLATRLDTSLYALPA